MLNRIIGFIIVLIFLVISLIGKLICVLIGGDVHKDIDFLGGYSGGDVYQDDAYREYKHLRKPKKTPTFEEFCYPSKYKIQPQQEFAADYMKPGNGNGESMLIFHKIGAGKSCLSIQVSEKWKKKGKPLLIMPASLIPGFRSELRSKCAGDTYLTQSERDELADLKPGSKEYRLIIKRSDARIDEVYQLYSYNKFASSITENGVKSIKAPIIIVDEVQNINGTKGTFFTSVAMWIDTHRDAPVVLMSGTPIFDSSKEIYGLAQLLRIENIDKKTGEPVELFITPENISKLFANKVSYYAGAPPHTFPTVYVKVKKCVMSKHQARWYKSEVEAEMNALGDIKLKQIANDFYIKSRQRSNIVYPNGLKGQAGMTALTKTLIRNSLETYSCKYAALMKKLRRGGLSFVYVEFTRFGGIAALSKILRASGWSDFSKNGPGTKTFVVWSGDQTKDEKDTIRATFNSEENDDGSQIQVIIGSPSIKEGVSLLRVRSVHVMSTYWNHSRLEQVYGRAVRYCSHKFVPKSERDVTIYIYAAVTSKRTSKDPSPLESIDLYMLAIADKKKDESEPYVTALMDVAVDRYLFNKST
jgi:hypothetical protein